MVELLTEILLRGLPVRDDRLQEDRVLVLHERHQVHVVLAPDDEDALAGVTARFGCSRMSSRSPRSMWKTMSSNPMPRSALSFAFFASSQSKYFTELLGYHDVCLIGTRWRRETPPQALGEALPCCGVRRALSFHRIDRAVAALP
jgi:hypothetical protein